MQNKRRKIYIFGLTKLQPSIRHFKSFNLGPLGSHFANSSFNSSSSCRRGPRIVSSNTPLIDQGSKYGFGVVRALKGSICNGIVFIELVSKVFLKAKLKRISKSFQPHAGIYSGEGRWFNTHNKLVHHRSENDLLQYKSFPLMRMRVRTLLHGHANLRCG